MACPSARPAAAAYSDGDESTRDGEACAEHRGRLLRSDLRARLADARDLVLAGGIDPQANWYATAQESAAGLLDLYRQVQAFADETISALPLDAIGHVAHWGGAEVTLHEIMVHTTVDLQSTRVTRTSCANRSTDPRDCYARANNLPSEMDWPAYVAKLAAIAESSDAWAAATSCTRSPVHGSAVVPGWPDPFSTPLGSGSAAIRPVQHVRLSASAVR